MKENKYFGIWILESSKFLSKTVKKSFFSLVYTSYQVFAS